MMQPNRKFMQKSEVPTKKRLVQQGWISAQTSCGMHTYSGKLKMVLSNPLQLFMTEYLIPTQLYSHHFEKFQEHVSNNLPIDLLSTDEFLQLRKEYLEKQENDESDDTGETTNEASSDAAPPAAAEDDALPPGEETDIKSAPVDAKETQALRTKIIEIRRGIHKKTEEEVGKRWCYEEAIKRPYFHVKPLEKAQLKNWKEYLDFEIKNVEPERVIILFERCMVACALYEEFWIKYANHMAECKKEQSMISAIYRRACRVHLPKKITVHLEWAAYEEKQGNVEKAREILLELDKSQPDLVLIALRRINLERRLSNYDEVEQLYKTCIESAKLPENVTFYSIKYARYCFKVRGDGEKATAVLNSAIEKDKNNSKLYLQLLDIAYQSNPIDEKQVLDIFNRVEQLELDPDMKYQFSKRKLEFLEDFGSNIGLIMEASNQHDALQKERDHNSRKRKADDGLGGTPADKKNKTDAPANANSAAYANRNQPPPYQQPYQQQQQQQANWSGQTGTGYDYNQWAAYNQAQSGYGYGQSYGYGQQGWGGYGQYGHY